MGKLGAWLTSGFGTGLGGLLGGPVGAIVGNVAGSLVGQHLQRKENRRARKYNAPKAQMKRYIEAGLNPNLIYTQGSPGAYGPPVNYQEYSNIGSQAQQSSYLSEQSEYVEEQTLLAREKAAESRAKQSLMDAQESVLRANPYLDKDYVSAMIQNVQLSVEQKRQDMVSQGIDITLKSKYGDAKMAQEMEMLKQKFQLVAQEIKNKDMDWWVKVGQRDNQDADLRLKAQVLKYKKFQNIIAEVEARFMADGDITPKMYLDFFKTFLNNLAGRGKN